MIFPHNITKSLFLCAFVVASFLSVRADSTFGCKIATVDPSGTYSIQGLSFGLAVFSPSWGSVLQSAITTDGGFPKSGDTTWETQGTLKPESGPAIVIKEKLSKISDSSFQCSYHTEGPQGAPLVVTNLLSFVVHLPAAAFAGKTLMVDGESVPLPATEKGNSFYDKWGAQHLEIPTAGGIVSIDGDLKIHIQDERVYQEDSFLLWLAIAKADNSTGSSNLDLTFTVHPTAADAAPVTKQ